SRKLRALHVAQHDDANLPLGKHADGGGHAECVSTMLPGELISIILNHPAHAVRAEALYGNGISAVAASTGGGDEDLWGVRLPPPSPRLGPPRETSCSGMSIVNGMAIRV